MRFTKLFLPTLKEAPSDAEVISHKLMIRAGMIRRLAAGIYDLLPLGLMAVRKVENIIREELNKAGAQEVLLPSIQPAELWQESGRWEMYGKELLRIKDRHQRDFCYGPTHEEVITDLVRREVRSYRQLPLNLYQIQTKFRDEIRPRFGVMRCREFTMKDGYSFDTDEKGAEETYRKMYDAYSNIFRRCGLKFRAVEAETGQIGGSFSHEFMVLAESGEDSIAACEKCDYAANVEKAEVRSHADLSPKVSIGERGNEGVGQGFSLAMEEMKPMEVVSTPDKKSVEEVSEFLKVEKERIVKTLIFETENGIVAALVRGDHDVNETKLKNLLKCDVINLAGEKVVEDVTSASSGFAGPAGLKLKIAADNAVIDMKNFVTGANLKDAHCINANTGRDFNIDVYGDIRMAKDGDICPKCNGALRIYRGIEVGHVFKLGTKYSKSLKAVYLDDNGKEKFMVMGCYGIGVGRTVAASIEQNHDDNGIIWPVPIAPFQIMILPLNMKNSDVVKNSEDVYHMLIVSGIEVLLDDRDERPGIKFKDADLIGIPIQIIVGEKNLKEGKAEIKVRKDGRRVIIPVSDIKNEVVGLIKELMI
ncbi:MAG: proline--tRNA ligase [Nitrospinae bacterium]|nr:proline--tRNA ligase [Nitrospinota bacterium]